MDYEKAYKDALAKARHYYLTGKGEPLDFIKMIFPEFAESEDEKIRKELIDYHRSMAAAADDYVHEAWIAWLEKQGTPAKLSEEEQNRFAKGVLTSCALSFIDYLEAHKCEGKMCASNGECEDIENAFHNAMWDRLHRYYCKYIEKQDDQKNKINSCKITFEDVLALECAMKTIKITKGCAELYKILVPLYDKIHNAYLVEKQGKQKEPQVYKTKDDEIITYSETNGYKVVEPKFKVGDWITNGLCAWRIDSIDEDMYYTNHCGIDCGGDIKSIDEEYHIWTINDAKPGDVLSDGTTVFIFKDLLSDGSVMSYCDYDTDSGESDAFCPLSMNLMCSKITPATKEQCDLLSQKMHEAGYEWDAEKKELKKIKQEPIWEWDAEKKELKKIEQKPQRMISAEAKEAMYDKPSWSEEDSVRLERIIDVLWYNRKGDTDTIYQQEQDIDWLKSLKQRIVG